MNKEIDIELYDEIGDETVIKSSGKLNLETGWISNVVPETDCGYETVDKHPDYNFSYALLKINSKELEFTVGIEKSGQYKVSRAEFNEVKEKAIKLLTSTSGSKYKM